MVTCPNCGVEASVSDERCPGCTIPLQVGCPECGAHASFDEDTCPACGHSLAQATEPA